MWPPFPTVSPLMPAGLSSEVCRSGAIRCGETTQRHGDLDHRVGREGGQPVTRHGLLDQEPPVTPRVKANAAYPMGAVALARRTGPVQARSVALLQVRETASWEARSTGLPHQVTIRLSRPWPWRPGR